MIQKLNRLAHAAFIKPLLQVYLRTEPKTTVDGFRLRIRKGVFHPKLFFSTGYLYDFIKSLDLREKTFLELGCGSGLISLLALRKGALVTSADLSQAAIASTAENVSLNFAGDRSHQLVLSDVFEALPPDVKFDVIAINPPYYFKDPGSEAELAWYCGSDGKYFQKLFGELKNHVHSNSRVFMILEENCEITRIGEIAAAHGVKLVLADEKRIKWETSYIFRLDTVNASY